MRPEARARRQPHGILRVWASDSLVIGFLAHTGLTLDEGSVTLT
jgi:hypothetical protein